MKPPKNWSHRLVFESKRALVDEITELADLTDEELVKRVKVVFPSATGEGTRQGNLVFLIKDALERNFPVNIAAI